MKYWHTVGVGLRPLKKSAFYVLSKIHRSTRPRVAIIVDDEVLLVQNWGDAVFALPGGGAHRGEDIRGAARREIQEELGVAIPLEELKYIDTVALHYYDAPLFVWKTTIKPQITPQKLEITAFGWYSASKLSLVGTGTRRLLELCQLTSVR